MVDCNLLDLGQISNDQRRAIIEFVRERKGVKPKDLGVTDAYLRMVKLGKARAGDGLLCQALKYVTEDELKLLLKGIVPEARASLNDAVRVIATARIDPEFREFLLGLIKEYLGDYITTLQQTWHVTEKDIDEFIKAKRLKGRSEKTIRDEVRYIRRALAWLDWNLTPDGIREYLAELAEEGEAHVIGHTTASLKSFLKEVLKPRDPGLFALLYSSFTVIRPKNHNRVRLPTIDQLRQIWQQLPTIEARLYFTILAECGLRPSEPFLVSIEDVDFEHGVIHIGKVTETKRAFIAFLRPEVIDWIKREYLPIRESLVRAKLDVIRADYLGVRPNAEEWAKRFIPFDRDRLRREIKDVARQVLNREFELYELRKFFATYLISQGVPESIVNTFQGRAPPSEFRVLIEHYWSPRHEELRQWYLRFAPRVCC
ncbi:MAG: site-specific integrase [Vulcanisaeta sp.]|nr:site-specific integrase [Vulcanisaeta sp.]